MKKYIGEKICMYCSEPNGSYSTFLVRKAIKPKGYPCRWIYIGYCCDKCHEVFGKPIQIEETNKYDNER